MKLKTLLISALALTAFAGVRADEITVAGTTTGTFSATGTSTYNTMSFTPGAFNDTTVGGGASIGGNVGDNFGTITLMNPPPGPAQNYSGTFTLQITFTLPVGTNPNPGSFTANVTGSVSTGAGGTNLIDFSPKPQLFTFSNSQGSGSFGLIINDVSVTPGQTLAISGRITGATFSVPDGGATVALLGVAFIGFAFVRSKIRTA